MFERWKEDFKDLYNCQEFDNFDNELYNRAKIHKLLHENNINDPLYETNESLNSNISLEEIAFIIQKCKSGSACGIDNLPYDVLKNPPVIAVLQQLFQLVFDTSIIPSIWRKAIIYPIFKDPQSDKRIPMNYRGISLLSCVSKLYTAFLNKRSTLKLKIFLQMNKTDSGQIDHVKIMYSL